jgi:hypothetical protein
VVTFAIYDLRVKNRLHRLWRKSLDTRQPFQKSQLRRMAGFRTSGKIKSNRAPHNSAGNSFTVNRSSVRHCPGFDNDCLEHETFRPAFGDGCPDLFRLCPDSWDTALVFKCLPIDHLMHKNV